MGSHAFLSAKLTERDTRRLTVVALRITSTRLPPLILEQYLVSSSQGPKLVSIAAFLFKPYYQKLSEDGMPMPFFLVGKKALTQTAKLRIRKRVTYLMYILLLEFLMLPLLIEKVYLDF